MSFENPVYFNLISLEITEIFFFITIGSIDLQNVKNHALLKLSHAFKNHAFQIKYKLRFELGSTQAEAVRLQFY